MDGEPIRLEQIVYFAVNKPKGYVSTNFDPSGRPRVVDLLPEIPERVYAVGRLDEDSTGLMILTNDGELANRLAHPRFGVEKMYRALVAGMPDVEIIAKLTEGVWLSDGKVRAKRARIVGRQGQATLLELVLAEGKKREVRRMLSKLGHKVMSLNRVAIGPITLKGLPVGECRPLSRHEVDLLRKVASGIAVSVPGFPESEASPRSRRNGQRGDRPRPHSRQADQARSQHRDEPRPSREENRRAVDEAAREGRLPRRPADTRGRAAHDGPQPARPHQRRPPTPGTQGGPPDRGPRGRAVDTRSARRGHDRTGRRLEAAFSRSQATDRRAEAACRWAQASVRPSGFIPAGRGTAPSPDHRTGGTHAGSRPGTTRGGPDGSKAADGTEASAHSRAAGTQAQPIVPRR